ncbi:Gfo/Idh/MocA family oxidoreductase [Vibrio astriarenae]|uniref:Gfo/Idh/MocA family oxidoreductase n=1 Tax=Vibrio astriarenae TaxID=1481923 RepID=A0A7Z2T8B8_9VIBR|nr:Gfo/Idh/MocA family oxidoreductase [Vibrio astriarenae]QIA66082.1 Gfo/Idh/MocA family oxidoreductase [Vibrio astriarenae]
MSVQSSPNIRWGIIGPGRIAHRFADAFSAVEDGELYAVASRNENRLHEFADQFSINKRYSDYQAILADKNVDAIYIATPHRFHFDLAKQALESGKAVLCEKPLTVTSAQSQALFELANKNQVFLMEALWSRFLPAWQQIKQWLAEGAIGDVVSMHSTFGFKAERNNDDRLFNLDLAGGALLDTGVYNIAMSDFVMGTAPDTIVSDVLVGETGVDERSNVTLSFGDVVSEFTCSFLEPLPNEFKIVGSKGSIVAESNFWEANSVQLFNQDGTEQWFSFPYLSNGFEYQVLEVNRCLREGKLSSDNVSPEFTIRNMAVMDAILAQAGVKYPFLEEFCV